MSMIGNFRRVSAEVLDQVRREPDGVTAVLYPEGDQVLDDSQLDVDKAWHGIHFLLTGEAWGGTAPLNFIVGGEEIGDVDVGYGPARGFGPAEVQAIAAALVPITAETLRERFDAAALEQNEIYPTIWAHEGDEACDYLIEYFELLKQFVLATAEARGAMLVYIN